MPVTVASEVLIRVGHSPDPDDAFMFYALTKNTIPTGNYRFTHELVDIETLNRRAFSGELELTALSLHAYAHLADKYTICTCGASMGDQYGPMVVARKEMTIPDLRGLRIVVPGTLTTAFLALSMCLEKDFEYVVAPFDEILDIVEKGEYEGKPVDAGLIIHEGQLTYQRQNLHLIVDLGKWWYDKTQLPLPLGCNGIRKDLGPGVAKDVNRLLRDSIKHGLDHRQKALEYAQSYGRGLDTALADKFVGMYVNDWTIDFGPRGRKAVEVLLAEGFKAGVIPKLVVPEFVDESL